MEMKQKLRKVGSSYVITIPMDLIRCKVLDVTKPLKVVLSQDNKNAVTWTISLDKMAMRASN